MSSCLDLNVYLRFQLNDAFTLYKKEKAENDRLLNETNDRLQRQLTELRSSHAKLTSQLEFSNKRWGFFLHWCFLILFYPTNWHHNNVESLESVLTQVKYSILQLLLYTMYVLYFVCFRQV